ncbi:activator-dependent family glycosyltransferase [Micromonospora sp. WMMD882]|uniref:activator-dependent family glycosyltransferase n=1 Tax=Micromonospora sp. WMMD882 TaxID=3015151 RepID=UPI00248AA638|nr:activator-dependent family glycosyltransferase [Micromonospora sp. WMMD882]WBB78685.1 activator-dependent family glycosyltransferase [Micromonospora sp. WMMD882]
MRVLFLAGINKSHLYAMTPLAWALQIAGHQVRVASQPDLADDVARTGFTPAPVGRELRMAEKLGPAAPTSAADRSGGWVKPVDGSFPEDPHGHLESIVSGFFPMVCPEPMFDDLIAYAQDWKPDLIIWNTLALAGGVAARISGAAHARLLFGADGLGQIRSAFHARRAGLPVDELPEDPLAGWLGPILRRHGHDFDEEVALGQWTIDPMPSWVFHPRTNAHYVPLRHVPYNGPARIPDWMREPPSRPRVCLTLGVSHRESHGVEASPADLMEAVADLDAEIVATLDSRQTATLDHVPDNVRVVDFVPMNALLPSCAAIVHHGGTQTFAAALENAVPQLLVPSAYWTEKWWGPVAEGNGLERRGAGIYVADSDWFAPEMLREALTRVLKDPSFKENAVRLRAERQAVPTANELVPTLERLTAAHQARR